MKKSTSSGILGLIAVLWLSGICQSTVIRVPADQPTIQDGLNAASSGDTVLVAAGTYEENIRWPNIPCLTLQGENPQDRPVTRNLTYAPEDIGSELVILDFIFQNSGSYYNGGAISIINSHVQITHCQISSCGADHQGGGVYFSVSRVEIADSTISDNHSMAEGGGGYFDTCLIDISGSTIERNNTGVESYFTYNGLGLYLNHCSGTIRGSIIRDHCNEYFEGAGIYSTGGVDIIGNIIEDNIAEGSDYDSGAVYAGGNCLISDNIFSRNYGMGAAIIANWTTVITNNLFIENQGFSWSTGAIYGDPGTVSFCTFIGGTNGAIGLHGGLGAFIHHCIFIDNDQAIIDGYDHTDAICDYNVFYNNGVDYYGEEPGEHDRFDTDPLFVTGPIGAYYLSQIDAGQDITSPCVDAGDPMTNPPNGTTRTDEIADTVPPDIGFHYPLESQLTPTPSPTPVFTTPPTPTPTPEPTPQGGIRYTLLMPDTELQSGDRFQLEICRSNYQDTFLCDEYLVLQIDSWFWFWPSWSQSVDGVFAKAIPARHSHDIIFDFDWPDVADHTVGNRFWAAILNPGSATLIVCDMVEWSY